MNLLRRLSLRAQLLLMFLSVAFICTSVIGVVGYFNGKKALLAATEHQLVSLRDAKANEASAYFKNIRNHVSTLSEDRMVIDATNQFSDHFAGTSDTVVNHTKAYDKLSAYYEKDFAAKLPEKVRNNYRPEIYVPEENASVALQLDYIVNNPFVTGKKSKLTRPKNRKREGYHKSHELFHPIFKHLKDVYDYYDVFLIEAKTGTIVYSVSKEVDFGTDLLSGPYATTNLGKAFRRALEFQDRSAVVMTDYAPYRPSYDDAAAFLASPIYDKGKRVGVLAIQLPVSEINRMMSGNFEWKKHGLGDSGGAYMVGKDHLMRTDSRFILEDKTKFLEQLTELGIEPKKIQEMKRLGTTILQKSVDTVAVEQALKGKSGSATIVDYRSVEVLSSYCPLDIEGVEWVLVVDMEVDEAFQPVRDFEKKVLIATGVIVLVITLGVMVLSNDFIKPITMLKEGANNISLGQTSTRIEDTGRDEIADLAEGFNNMAQKIQDNTDEILKKSGENEKLLLNILPTAVAERLTRGEKAIADKSDNVTVLFADVSGFATISRDLSAEESVSKLNAIIGSIDEAAERHGVEKIKTNGSSYLAASGLAIPRIDHAFRVYQFAKELRSIIVNYAVELKAPLEVSIGISSGSVIAGVVGDKQFSYDMWGDTVSQARALLSHQTGHTIKFCKRAAELVKASGEGESLKLLEKLDTANFCVEVWTETFNEEK